MMKNKNNLIIIGILATGILLFSFVFIVSALSSEEQEELSQLEENLTEEGYSWLINYSIDYPEIIVYEINGEEEIARFENISLENWHKIFLTKLNGTQDSFDLKVGKIPEEILLKKLRIDRIREEMRGDNI